MAGGRVRPGRSLEEIAGTLDPRRARWVIEQLTPTNIGDEAVPDSAPTFPTPSRKGEAWSRAVHATALPDRWLVVGYRGGAELFRKWGKAVPDLLATTPTPDPALDPDDEVPVDETEPPGDDPMRWMLDYEAAVEVGMGITVTGDDLPQGESLAGGLERLVVVGVDWTLSPEAAANRLGLLLNGHRVSDGCRSSPRERPQTTPARNEAARLPRARRRLKTSTPSTPPPRCPRTPPPAWHGRSAWARMRWPRCRGQACSRRARRPSSTRCCGCRRWVTTSTSCWTP